MLPTPGIGIDGRVLKRSRERWTRNGGNWLSRNYPMYNATDGGSRGEWFREHRSTGLLHSEMNSQSPISNNVRTIFVPTLLFACFTFTPD
jgi:hypothetical protein